MSRIGTNAFTGNENLTLTVFPDSTALNYAIENGIPYKTVKALILPQSLTAIEAEAFMNGTFEAVVIPDGCTAIGSKAFANCSNLLYVRIPSSMGTIEPDAFSGSGNAYLDYMK